MTLGLYNLKTLFVAVALMGVLSLSARAADLTVVCASGSSCTSDSHGAAIFNEVNLAPGSKVGRNIEVRNDRKAPCSLLLDVNSDQSENILPASLYVTITDDLAVVQYGKDNDKTMKDLINDSPVELGTLPANSYREYSWQVVFDKDAGNEYQGKQMEFDFDLNFSCDDEKTVGSVKGTRSGGIAQKAIGKVAGLSSSVGGAVASATNLIQFPSAGGSESAAITSKENSRFYQGMIAIALLFILWIAWNHYQRRVKK